MGSIVLFTDFLFDIIVIVTKKQGELKRMKKIILIMCLIMSLCGHDNVDVELCDLGNDMIEFMSIIDDVEV